ncbi:MAG: bifunctional demethylmenaquinone methyltransferase/2-methoxy-6-polyprenyl-1,4-benzoquinol methylase UbiE [Bacteroidaceae bacterium]|jgi:demethylmenaquinone methyltransferase/2-methoxy-6-polyprenyl-1,4-benzoquinol methylase
MNYAQDKIKPYSPEGSKAKQVETMFDHIAHAYDRLNHYLSWGIDRQWRKKALRTLLPHHPQEMMDVATGTGDFALLACRMLNPQKLIATDISEGMMQIGRKKAAKAGLTERITFAREDCTQLSFADNSFDAITVAFGIRNFENLDKGLQEIHRVLRPGGKFVILELTTPEHFPMKQLYHLYSRWVIPTIGRLLSHDRCAYTYLPSSIQAFPQGEIMRKVLQKNGFSRATFQQLTCGICTLYTAEK